MEILKITLPEKEMFDPETNTFSPAEKEKTIVLKHSLVSLAKWESEIKKPFLSGKNLTTEEMLYYIECMTLTPNVTHEDYKRITPEHIRQIEDYISDPMTATTFSQFQQQRGGREIITAEIIYYWMITLNIPIEFQKWHLNRLMTLIRVCGIKNAPKKKMSRRAAASRQHSLNALRRRSLGTSG